MDNKKSFMETFDSTKASLYNIFKDINKCKIRLPDFQRGWESNFIL